MPPVLRVHPSPCNQRSHCGCSGPRPGRTIHYNTLVVLTYGVQQAAGYFKDDDMVSKLSLILAQRFFSVPPAAGEASASSQPTQQNRRALMKRALQVRHPTAACPALQCASPALIGAAPGPHCAQQRMRLLSYVVHDTSVPTASYK